MKDKRKKGQSWLDYLQTTYGGYSVSNVIEIAPDEYIPTQKLVLDLLDTVARPDLFEIVETLPILGDANKIYLTQSVDGVYQAYVYINGVAVSIGNIGDNDAIRQKIDNLESRVDTIEQTIIWNEFN